MSHAVSSKTWRGDFATSDDLIRVAIRKIFSGTPIQPCTKVERECLGPGSGAGTEVRPAKMSVVVVVAMATDEWVKEAILSAAREKTAAA